MILVTGNVGGELVNALINAGEQVGALTRSSGADARLPPGIEGVEGDLD